MDIQLVCLDTSFVRSKHKEIEILYPKHKSLYCISEPTDLELNDQNQKSTVEKSIRQTVFNIVLEMSALLPRGEVLLKEIEAYVSDKKLRQDFVICNPTLQESRRKHILEENKAALLKMENRISDMNFWENYYWKCIKEESRSVVPEIKSTEIDNEVDKIIKDKYPIYIDKNVNITALILGNKDRFKTECPSSYNYIKTLGLLRIISKPSDSTKQFKINASGIEIDIKRSFITDIVIAASFLPYIDIFATCDKGQYEILKFVFNQYASKIKYHDNQEGT